MYNSDVSPLRSQVRIINRIGDLSRRPEYFNEVLPYSHEVPYRLTRRDVCGTDDVPLHYGTTLEIVLYEDVAGTIVVDNRHLYVEGKNIVVIPPNLVHSGWVTGEKGVIYSLHVSLENISHYMNIDNFLSEQNCALEDAPPLIPEWEGMRALIDVLSTQDDNVFARNIAILRIFELIAKHTPSCSRHIEHAPNNTEELKALIAWTHQNYGQKITLDSAAAVVGFSKHYFCKWFKARTGINYIQYVKRVRIYNASKFLLIGRSVSEASYDCEFENLSYFIRCFKEIHGCTPKEYAHCILNCGAPSENI